MTASAGAEPTGRRILITGASGFVGSEVVRQARRRGHRVVALIRPAGRVPDGFGDDEDLELARLDLRSSDGLVDALDGVDSVIHLAAAKAGDLSSQFAGTVVATEHLLAAMGQAGVRDLVAISTFSVYDYGSLASGALLDEQSPIDTAPARRDEYARTKLVQETLYRHFGELPDHRVAILRPGMIYGADNLWHALLGTGLGPAFLRIGARATLPLTYVENCAEAMVLAAEVLAEADSPLDGETINIVDDDLPTQAAYVAAVQARTTIPPTITVPWPLVRAGAGLLGAINRRWLDGRAKFPGIAVAERLDARFKPLRYTNDKAKRLLGWTPRHSLDEAIERSLAAEGSADEASHADKADQAGQADHADRDTAR